MNFPTKQLVIITTVFISAVFLSGCKSFTTSKIDEGTIDYDISYPNPSEISMSADLMPKTLSFKFKDNWTLTEISAGLGVFNTYVITDKTNHTITQRLKVMGKKYMVSFNKKQIDSIISSEPKMKIVKSNVTKVIAGYKCNKATIIYDDVQFPSVDIYYTNDIKLPDANWYSYYKGIDGVLMEFYIKRYDIHMKMVAKSVSKEGVDENTFKPDPNYTRIPYKEMDSYFKMY